MVEVTLTHIFVIAYIVARPEPKLSKANRMHSCTNMTLLSVLRFGSFARMPGFFFFFFALLSLSPSPFKSGAVSVAFALFGWTSASHCALSSNVSRNLKSPSTA